MENKLLSAVQDGRQRLVDQHTPVSYTHLDVYKRQAYALDLIAGCIDGIPQLLLVQRLFRVDHRLGFCLRGRHPFYLREGLSLIHILA